VTPILVPIEISDAKRTELFGTRIPLTSTVTSTGTPGPPPPSSAPPLGASTSRLQDDAAAALTKSKIAPKTPLKGHSELQALWEAVQTAGPPVPTELRLLWEAASPKEAAAKEPAPAATAPAREAETAMAFPPDLQALWDAAVKLQELQELHHKGEQ
jgi:hypothetical protein